MAQEAKPGDDGRRRAGSGDPSGSGVEVDAGVPRHIVIEGPIGVGKTSLARRLAHTLGAELMLEEPDGNPFLPRFYENPRAAALPTQLFFLFQRARQLESLRQSDLFAAQTVADYLLDKDRLFAELTLDSDELQLYRQIWDNVVTDVPHPDLVVYLQAPVDVLQERIARRGVRYEQGMSRTFLDRLAEAYARYFHDFADAPLLIVNAAGIDPVHDDRDYDQLLQAIRRIRHGRHFFNPAGSGIV